MSRTSRVSCAGVFFVFAVSAACTAPAQPPTPAAVQPVQSPVERGRYLVTIGGCSDCHTPFKLGAKGPEPDMSRMLSGHPEGLKLPPPPAMSGPWVWAATATSTAFAGPWGISYAMNLTPDGESGLGNWTESMFVQAMRTGKHMGASRPILPPMPWAGIGKMTDDDLKALYAFLRSIPPIVNHVPAWVDPKAGNP